MTSSRTAFARTLPALLVLGGVGHGCGWQDGAQACGAAAGAGACLARSPVSPQPTAVGPDRHAPNERQAAFGPAAARQEAETAEPEPETEADSAEAGISEDDHDEAPRAAASG